MSLGAFFEALFKYGKDYGLSLWHFMALAVLGCVIWVGARVASGAGKALTGAQGVYLKMIADLQARADADRATQLQHLTDVQKQLELERTYNAQLAADLQKERDEKLALAREAADLRLKLASIAHDGAPDEPAAPQPA